MGRYSDVMLVSDDQIQFNAHKIVLSACSPVFKKIIERSSNHHPLIYLRGIQSYEIESIIQFMYHGEGKCYYERMRELLKVAQDLEVKNISDGVELPSEEAEETVEENAPEMDNEESFFKESSGQAGIICQRSQMSSKKSSQCPECGALYSERSNMLRHYRSKHEGVKYSCAQCGQQFSQQSTVQKHIESVHEGVKYPCPQCDYQASEKCSLQAHIQSIHEGIKYPCNQCDYQATQRGNLQTHIQIKHEGVKYPCNHCDYQANRKHLLWRHLKNQHELSKDKLSK